MGMRKKPRVKMVVPIRIWGMDSSGKPFNVLAYTLDVSGTGARIGGVKVSLGVGEAVTVQYKQQRALFKVAWIGRPGDKTQEQIGVALLEQDRQIWSEISDPETFTDSFSGRRTATQAEPAPVPPLPTQDQPAPVAEMEVAPELPAAETQESVRVIAACESPLDPDEMIRACAQGLLHIEQVVKRTPPTAEALQEFRDAISKIRQTVWALQQWHEVKGTGGGAFPLLSYLNTERLRFVVQAVQDLANDVATKGVELDGALLSTFFQGVEQLRSKTPTTVVEPEGFSVEVTTPEGAIVNPRSSAMVAEVRTAEVTAQRSSMTSDAALNFLAREFHRILGVDGVAIARLEDNEMVCVGSYGNAAEAGMVMETEEGLGGEAMSSRGLVYCADTQTDRRVDAALCKQARIGSVVMVPVESATMEITALMEASSARPHAFGAAQLDALRVAAQVVRSIVSAHAAA